MPASMQQSPAPPSPPAPVEAPAAPPAPGAFVVKSGALQGAVMSRQDVAALQARRSELSRQLESASGRRRSIAEQIRRADGADKKGLESRLAVIDGRMARLEGEIDEVGQQLASPAAARLAGTEAPREFGPNFGPNFKVNGVEPTPILIVFTLFVLSPIALSISRLVWKRGSMPARSAATQSDSGPRLERIEQAMDAIALEVERVSEGQRFVTRLLSEQRGIGALGAAQPGAEPLRVPVNDVRASR